MERRPTSLLALLALTLIALGCSGRTPDAITEIRRQAEQGDADAQFSLGVMYDTGEGVPQDYGEALRWYRLAADQGHAGAQSNLGVMYGTGRGVPQDDGEALRWYRLAADQGHAGAQSNLGVMYGTGRGVPQDDGEAFRWYRLAADQGHAGAQYNLALMYGTGRGVPQDYVAAHMWANLAADQGHENALQLRDDLADDVTDTSAESPFQAAAEAVDFAALRMTDLSARAPRNARDVAQAGADLRIAADRLRQGSVDIDSLQELLSNARDMAVAGKRTAAYRQQPFSSDPVDAINAAIDALGAATPGQRAPERAAVALGDRMREIEEQRRPEYEVALARFAAAAAAAERGDGTWAAALAAGETVLALATAIEAEMSAIATEMAALEATAPPEVAAIAAPNRMDFEQAVAEFESVVVGLQEQLEVMRDFVAELSIDEQTTPRSPVTLEMLGDARLAIKDSDDRIVEVSLGGQGGIGNRQRSIYLEVLRGTSVLHAKELGENAVRIVERSWSDMEAADYTIVVSRTGPPVLSSRESDERIIVEGSKGKFESDISWK